MRLIGSSLVSREKIRIDWEFSWRHHRGGWTRVIEVLKENCHSPRGVHLVSAVEDQLRDRGPLSEPWVGFLHQVPHQTLRFPDLHRLVQREDWAESMKYCLGLFSLTHYQRNFLRSVGVTVPISVVKYPVEFDVPPFDFDLYQKAPTKRCYMIGEFLRRYQDFFDIQVDSHQKTLIRCGEFNPEKMKLRLNDTVEIVDRIPVDAYDQALRQGIVFLSLTDAVANTTVIECIARATPVVVNRLPALEEYLGSSYPLFYDDLEQARELLHSEDAIHAGHVYLRNLESKQDLTYESFVEKFQNTSVYRSLPTCYPKANKFRRRDLTVALCVYRRIPWLKETLQRLNAQEFAGDFEVILWNNNIDAVAAVDEAVRQFKGTLDLKVIHSSENFYCGVRLAMPGLMRSDLLQICDDDVLPAPNYLTTFMQAYKKYGPDAVICARGHEFLPHRLDPDEPELVWNHERHLKFYDESRGDRKIHFMHADNCLIPRSMLCEALSVPMDDYEFVLVDDYWLSWVISEKLGYPIWKVQCDDAFKFTPAAEDREVAMFHSDFVREQRVNFYIYHMRRSWPKFEAAKRRASAPAD